MKAFITVCVLTTLSLTIIAQNVADDITNLLRVRIEGGGYGFRDETFIHFAEGATTAYDDEIDAKKWWSLDPEATMIWTVTSDGINVAINNLPLADLHTTTNSIPLHFVCGYGGGEYVLNFGKLESFDEGIEIWIEDAQTEEGWLPITITDSIYYFTGIPDDPSGRFMIHIFDPLAVHVNESPSLEKPIRIYAFDSKVYVKNNSSEIIKQINLFDMAGRKVYSTNASEQEKIQFNLNVKTGIYLVQVTTQKTSLTKKIHITKH